MAGAAGYGGVMLGIEYGLPFVVAGIHEGKNEINARVGYFHLGINLKSERPSSDAIKQAVENVLKNSVYRQNVQELAEEFERYNPAELTEHYVASVLKNNSRKIQGSNNKKILNDKGQLA